MTLELFGARATIKHLNIRKEGPQDDQILAVDVKLQLITDAGVLAYFHPTLRALLFNESGNPRIPQLDPISLDGTIKDTELKLGKIALSPVELKRFSFEPLAGDRVLVTFQASTQPTGQQIALLAELVQSEIDLDVAGQAQLFKHDTPVAQVARRLHETGMRDGTQVEISANGREPVVLGKGSPLAPRFEKKG